jgi:septal ring factor EnvC (AmiA/AmiB activator)
MSQHFKLLFLFVLIASFSAFGQSKEELQQKKEQLQKEINNTNKLLELAKKDKVQSVNTLRTLQRKIENRTKIIQTIEVELSFFSSRIEQLRSQIDTTKSNIEKKESELANLKEEYSNMLTYAYYNRNKYNRLAFVFSAQSFYQAFKRLSYLQEYSLYRRKQAEQIIEAEKQLQEELGLFKTQKALIALEKNQKSKNLSQSLSEQEMLSIEKAQQNNLVSSLKRKEKQLRSDLKQKQSKAKALNTQIRKIIEEEIRLARVKSSKSGNINFEMTPDQQLLADNFTQNKGKLPWPVERGVIVESFGIQKHPVLRGIETFNNGIKLSTETASFARAVFQGKVSRIISIPGAGKAIIINHGDYFTVYSNLSDVLVKAGEKVELKQNLGIVITNKKTNESITELQIWKGDEKLNPSDWLFKAY